MRFGGQGPRELPRASVDPKHLLQLLQALLVGNREDAHWIHPRARNRAVVAEEPDNIFERKRAYAGARLGSQSDNTGVDVVGNDVLVPRHLGIAVFLKELVDIDSPPEQSTPLLHWKARLVFFTLYIRVNFGACHSCNVRTGVVSSAYASYQTMLSWIDSLFCMAVNTSAANERMGTDIVYEE
ncbi:hypothetical protein PENSPDRAFT_56944 [Peniophora sp. CONT]|nr:hypothetical protein PENSPDRAFT_56944 [Peniophora sp. CONT]